MVNDVSRVFFRAKATRDVYVQLPDEDRQPGEEQLCGKLNFSMYGTRDAAMNWHVECSQVFIDNGFLQGIATPCVFYHKEKGIRTLVHGDDYVSVGGLEQLDWMKNMLEKNYQFKTQVLGPRGGDIQQLEVLNRIICWNGNEGITYEEDPRRAEIVIEQLQLQ